MCFPFLSRCSFFAYSAMRENDGIAHIPRARYARVFLANVGEISFRPEAISETHIYSFTHILAIPAFLTAELTAFMAVCMLFNSCVRSPVAVGALRCSASMNLVNVMQSESIIVFFDVIVAVSF